MKKKRVLRRVVKGLKDTAIPNKEEAAKKLAEEYKKYTIAPKDGTIVVPLNKQIAEDNPYYLNHNLNNKKTYNNPKGNNSLFQTSYKSQNKKKSITINKVKI